MLLKCHIGFQGEAHSSSCRQAEGQEGRCCCKRDDDVDLRRLRQTMRLAHWSVCPSQVAPMTWGSSDMLFYNINNMSLWGSVDLDDSVHRVCVCVCVCVWTSNHRQTGGTRRRQTTARDSIAARRGRVTSSSVQRARSHCHARSCLRFTCFKGGLAAVPIVPWPVATGAPVWTHLGIGGSVLAYSRCNALPHILYKAR